MFRDCNCLGVAWIDAQFSALHVCRNVSEIFLGGWYNFFASGIFGLSRTPDDAHKKSFDLECRIALGGIAVDAGYHRPASLVSRDWIRRGNFFFGAILLQSRWLTLPRTVGAVIIVLLVYNQWLIATVKKEMTVATPSARTAAVSVPLAPNTMSAAEHNSHHQ